jgi:uncharacterized protein
MQLQDVVGDYQTFIHGLLGQVTTAGFDLSDFLQMDHLCYRTISQENYDQKKQELAAFGTLVRETSVNERLIATYRLRHPIIVDGWRVDALELPAPKPGSAHAEGLEHVEFVLFDSFELFRKKYADKTFNLASAERGINPEISYQLDGCAVKFHLLSLLTAVFLEDKLNITEVK